MIRRTATLCPPRRGARAESWAPASLVAQCPSDHRHQEYNRDEDRRHPDDPEGVVLPESSLSSEAAHLRVSPTVASGSLHSQATERQCKGVALRQSDLACDDLSDRRRLLHRPSDDMCLGERIGTKVAIFGRTGCCRPCRPASVPHVPVSRATSLSNVSRTRLWPWYLLHAMKSFFVDDHEALRRWGLCQATEIGPHVIHAVGHPIRRPSGVVTRFHPRQRRPAQCSVQPMRRLRFHWRHTDGFIATCHCAVVPSASERLAIP